MYARFVAQPFAGEANLHDFIARIVEDHSLRSLTVVVAWAKRSGLRHLRRPLDDFRGRGGESRMIVGIDEGGATRQGLETACGLFDQIHVFHDRSGRTFHPKIYLAQGEANAELLIGSNNLTAGGVFFNYEASLSCVLDLTSTEDVDLLDAVLGYIDRLYADDGACIELDNDTLERLVRDARYKIGDEDAIRRPQRLDDPENFDSDVDFTDASQTSQGLSASPSIFAGSRERKRGAPSQREETSSAARAGRSTVEADTPPQAVRPAAGARIVKRWFKQMTATDAQRPPQRGSKPSNPTGDLRLVQARHPIDQTTYFRQDFFEPLDWKSRPGSRGSIDEAVASFHVFIGRFYQGLYDLKVSDKQSREAGQRNYTSGLHWGPFAPVLATENFKDYYVVLERLDDDTYQLILTRDDPGPFIR